MAEHPDYRIRTENPWDHVLGFKLWILPGDFLRLHVETLYAHPKLSEARGGVAIDFGGNISYVTIENLNRAYRLHFEAAWYGVEVLFVPTAYYHLPPSLDDLFSLDEVTTNPDGSQTYDR